MKKFIPVLLIGLVILSSIPLGIWLLGKPSVDRYEVTDTRLGITVEVKNLGNSIASDVPLRLALPFDDLDHQELLEKEFSTPYARESNDSLGNRFVHYSISSIEPGSSFNVTMEFLVRSWSVDYEIKEDAEFASEEEDLSVFLKESGFINVNDPEIIRISREIADEADKVSDIPWLTYEWVLDNIYYQQIPGEWDAYTTLRNGEGGSAEFSNLFIALLRANGIPARRISGYGNFFEEGEELALTRFAHGWAEFYVKDLGWVQTDPAWGVTSRFDNFASTDSRHIIMTKGAGISFMLRGAYSEPFGDTELDTDYDLKVLEKDVKNLSVRRDVILGTILVIPLFFALFIVVRLVKRRKGD